MKWKKASIPFVSYSQFVDIKFTCETPGIQAGPVIDSVTIDRGEPEPQTITLNLTDKLSEFSWNTVPSFQYVVELRVDFKDANVWYLVGFPIATGSTLKFSDPDAPKRPYGVYRVRMTSSFCRQSEPTS